MKETVVLLFEREQRGSSNSLAAALCQLTVFTPPNATHPRSLSHLLLLFFPPISQRGTSKQERGCCHMGIMLKNTLATKREMRGKRRQQGVAFIKESIISIKPFEFFALKKWRHVRIMFDSKSTIYTPRTHNSFLSCGANVCMCSQRVNLEVRRHRRGPTTVIDTVGGCALIRNTWHSHHIRTRVEHMWLYSCILTSFCWRFLGEISRLFGEIL